MAPARVRRRGRGLRGARLDRGCTRLGIPRSRSTWARPSTRRSGRPAPMASQSAAPCGLDRPRPDARRRRRGRLAATVDAEGAVSNAARRPLTAPRRRRQGRLGHRAQARLRARRRRPQAHRRHRRGQRARVGHGALNVDGCRIEDDGRTVAVRTSAQTAAATPGRVFGDGLHGSRNLGKPAPPGRWPANVVPDGRKPRRSTSRAGKHESLTARARRHRDLGASNGGMQGGLTSGGVIISPQRHRRRVPVLLRRQGRRLRTPRVNGTAHPTVKPLDLMRWLVRLVHPREPSSSPSQAPAQPSRRASSRASSASPLSARPTTCRSSRSASTDAVTQWQPSSSEATTSDCSSSTRSQRDRHPDRRPHHTLRRRDYFA